jgi:hypothetical protein
MESVNYENKNVLLVYVPDVAEKQYGRIYVDYDYVIPEAEEGEEVIKPDITVKEDDERYNEYLLTDMVKDFTVKYATYKSKDENGNEYVEVQERTLDFVLTLEKNGKEFSQKYKASLRNSSPEGQTTELTIQMVNMTNDGVVTDE